MTNTNGRLLELHRVELRQGSRTDRQTLKRNKGTKRAKDQREISRSLRGE